MRKVQCSIIFIVALLVLPFCVYAKGYEIVSGDLDTVGSVVKIADEEFYVIGKEDSTHVKLLSKWNLNVGPNAKGAATNLQDSDVKGYLEEVPTYGNVFFSSVNYWYDRTNLVLKSEYGSDYPAYIYTNEKENGNYLASVAEYVDAYVTYLTNQDVIVTGRLINLDELVSLGCVLGVGCSRNYGGNAPDWVSQTSYWTGAATNEVQVRLVKANGDCTRDWYNNDGWGGVRPVIILDLEKKEEIVPNEDNSKEPEENNTNTPEYENPPTGAFISISTILIFMISSVLLIIFLRKRMLFKRI